MDGWDDARFVQGRMDEKILLLRKHLRSFLYENRSLYSLLSKGIHSLTEEECMELFEPVKLGIELILDEKIEQEEKANKIAQMSEALQAIKSNLQEKKRLPMSSNCEGVKNILKCQPG